MNVLKFIMSRSLVFFAALWVLSLVTFDYGKIRERVMIRTLNDNTPQGFTNFLRIIEGNQRQTSDTQELKQHAHYYEILIKYFPQLAEAHLLLGVSNYHLGKKQDSLAEVEKAAVLNPHFFWTQYDLGALHFERGEYKRSAEILERARLLKPEIALVVIKNSVVYSRLLLGVTNFSQIVMPKMRSGYSECYRLLVLSYLKLKDYANVIRLAHEAIAQGLDHKELFFYYAAMASYETKQHAASLNLLKEALEIDKNFPEAYELLALNLAALGDNEKAQEIRTKGQMLKDAGVRKSPGEDEIILKIF